jgi:pentatricopeptide repeat protein
MQSCKRLCSISWSHSSTACTHHHRGIKGSKQAYNALLLAYARAGDTTTVRQLFDTMHAAGVEPDEYSYNALLTSMARSSCSVQEVDKVGGAAGWYGSAADVQGCEDVERGGSRSGLAVAACRACAASCCLRAHLCRRVVAGVF